MNDSSLLEIGKIDKPHGLFGEVVVTLSTDRVERLEEGSELQTDSHRLTVREAKPHQHRWLVRFDEITSREQAADLHSKILYGAPIQDSETLWVHELIGAMVIDQHEIKRGVVQEVEANPASDLLVLEDGSLVPLTFVIDAEEGVIKVDCPAGLFDLSD